MGWLSRYARAFVARWRGPPKVEVLSIGGNCPVQAEGYVGDEPFYFRARGRRWSMTIGGDCTGIGEGKWHYSEAYPGGPYAAGWMTEAEAREFIKQAAERYVRGGV